MNITFIGGGNMASALIGGLLQQGFAPADLRVVEIFPAAREKLAADFGVPVFEALDAAAVASDVLLLAVKPQQLFGVAQQLAGLLENQLVVSIAAGIRASDLARWLGGHARVVRVMPNTPAMVRQGVSGLYALPGVSAADRDAAATILSAVGSAFWVDEESALDTVTALSGSGPAYVFYFLEAMQQAAVDLGLDAATGRKLALDTFVGACALAGGSPEELATLRQRVTSKGGTTERALSVMENADVRNHIVRAIRAAAERSAELGDELGNK